MQYLVSQPGAPTLRFNYDEWTSLLQPHGPLPADLHFNHDATAARRADCWTFDVSYDAIRGAGNELPPFRVAVRNVRRGDAVMRLCASVCGHVVWALRDRDADDFAAALRRVEGGLLMMLPDAAGVYACVSPATRVDDVDRFHRVDAVRFVPTSVAARPGGVAACDLHRAISYVNVGAGNPRPRAPPALGMACDVLADGAPHASETNLTAVDQTARDNLRRFLGKVRVRPSAVCYRCGRVMYSSGADGTTRRWTALHVQGRGDCIAWLVCFAVRTYLASATHARTSRRESAYLWRVCRAWTQVPVPYPEARARNRPRERGRIQGLPVRGDARRARLQSVRLRLVPEPVDLRSAAA